MPVLFDRAGNRYEYTALTVHGDSICLDGMNFIQGQMADFSVEGVKVVSEITVLAYRNRFTGAEKIAIEMAGIDDPSAAIEARRLSAEVRVFMKDLDAAKFIDTNDDNTRNGAMYLEAAGLLDEGRALEILDAPVQDFERL